MFFSFLVVPYVFPVQAWLELDCAISVPSSMISVTSSMCTVHSMSVCRKVSGMSVFTTFQLCFASMTHDYTIASKDTIGELVYSLVVYSHW